jgi:uncharacterized protein (DUF58 family)
MASERHWGQPRWLWTALAGSTVPSVMLLLFSLTVSGRTFAVMLLIAEAFVAVSLFLRWAQSERLRFEAELGGIGEQTPGT